ncbi:MAG: insulinase family protein [Prevotellaceae bacterium]|jgi:predicted Zn-dependent peptidase|nr:insulinase family protein [Prevotellaceae bacterium]
MDFQTLILPNGIRVVHKRVKSPVAYCGLTVNAGTRDELEDEHGMAHFLEHVLFKGTKSRNSLKISSLLENEGGDLNAFTTKEETAIHAVVLKGDVGKAFDIIADIVFNPLFPEAELEKEKDIVRDEINLYRDNPSEQIFDEFEELMFPACSLGRSILGTPKSLKNFTQEKVRNFVHRCYATNQMVFASVGNYSIDRVAALTDNYFSSVFENKNSSNRTAPAEYKPFDLTKKLPNYQANCLLGNRSFSYNDERRYALSLLTNMLGGPSQNSRLNLALREMNGLSYGVEVASTLYSDCGVTTIYFGTDKNSVEKCLALVNVELDKIRDKKLSTLELSRAKKQLIGQISIASESSELLMLSMAKSLLNHGKIEAQKEVEERIKAISAEEILAVAQEVFCREKMSSLIYT